MEFHRIMICSAVFLACAFAVSAEAFADQGLITTPPPTHVFGGEMKNEPPMVAGLNRQKKSWYPTFYSYPGRYSYYPYAYSAIPRYSAVYRNVYPYYGYRW